MDWGQFEDTYRAKLEAVETEEDMLMDEFRELYLVRAIKLSIRGILN